MIVITDVKYVHVEDGFLDTVEVVNPDYHLPMFPVPDNQPIDTTTYGTVTKTIIQGTRISRNGLPDIVVGATEEVQEILGISFEYMRKMKKQINEKDLALSSINRELIDKSNDLINNYKESKKTEDELNRYEKASFWQRLKYLWKGKI